MYLLPIYTVYKTYYNLGRDSISWNPAAFVKTSVIPPVQRNISIRKQFRDFYNLVNNLVSIFFYVGCQKSKTPVWVFFIFVKADPTGYARVPTLVRMHHMKTQFSWATPTGTHGEYENTQLEKS